MVGGTWGQVVTPDRSAATRSDHDRHGLSMSGAGGLQNTGAAITGYSTVAVASRWQEDHPKRVVSWARLVLVSAAPAA